MKRAHRVSPAAVSLAAAILLGAGCSHVRPARSIDESVSPKPGALWSPPPQGRAPAPAPTPAPQIPEKYLKGDATPTLPEVIDLALRNNPATRAAWFEARSAAADLGSKRAEFFPTVSLDANLTRQKTTAIGGTSTVLQTTYGPSASLEWLLFDFGGRQADVEEAQRALFAANWTHNAAIQTLVLEVEQAYYSYLAARGLAASADVSVKQAQESATAADERHNAGVSTIADVLQARTALSQAQLALESARGQIQTFRGALATAVGISPDVPVDLGDLPDIANLDEVRAGVESLIDKAQSERPDLAAARFEALKAQSHVRSVRAAGLPTISALGTFDRFYYYNTTLLPHFDNYSGAVLFHFPVFTGFQNRYDTLKAQEDASAAQAQADVLSNQVIFQVWTSYYAVQTSTQQVKTARDLLTSARQSEDVALARYKAGVGSILDLLTAQTALANARAQEIQARAGWFLALAQLAHDTGELSPPAGTTSGAAASGGSQTGEGR